MRGSRYYPEILNWLKKKNVYFFVYDLSPKVVSIRFPPDRIPNREGVVSEFKEFVKKVAKVKEIKDISDYVDVIMTEEYVIDPPLPDVDVDKLFKIREERPQYVDNLPKGFKKYRIYIVYGGRYKKVFRELYIKRGRKYLYIAEELPKGFSISRIPLSELRQGQREA